MAKISGSKQNQRNLLVLMEIRTGPLFLYLKVTPLEIGYPAEIRSGWKEYHYPQ